jgi:hypothetical protein
MSSPIQLDPQIHPRVDDRVKFINQLNGMPLESQKSESALPKLTSTKNRFITTGLT